MGELPTLQVVPATTSIDIAAHQDGVRYIWHLAHNNIKNGILEEEPTFSVIPAITSIDLRAQLGGVPCVWQSDQKTFAISEQTTARCLYRFLAPLLSLTPLSVKCANRLRRRIG